MHVENAKTTAIPYNIILPHLVIKAVEWGSFVDVPISMYSLCGFT